MPAATGAAGGAPTAPGGAPASSGVGRFAIVQNKVTSRKPGAQQDLPAQIGGAIVLEEVEHTGTVSAATMTFGAGARVDIGEESTFRVTKESLASATGEDTSVIDLVAGKVRVFVSRFLNGGRPVNVKTPSATVGIKGSEVVIESRKDGSVVVTVITGSASVTSRTNGSDRRELGVMQRLTVSPGGGALATPVAIGPAEADLARAGTEPPPTADRGSPGDLILQVPPAPPLVTTAQLNPSTLTQGPSSQGSVMSNPAATVMPGPMPEDICKCH